MLDLTLPFKLLGRVGRAVEMAIPTIFHPEQILGRSKNLAPLYDFTIKEARQARILAEGFKERARDIATRYNLGDEERMNQFLSFLEFPTYNKRFPTAQEVAHIPQDIKQAALEHLKTIEDPIYQIAKKANPDLGYIPGHFTHFPVKSYRNFLDDEITRVAKLARDLPKDDPLSVDYRHHLSVLNEQLNKISHVDDQLAAVRYQRLPNGGYFGPMDEARVAKKVWGYKKDYNEVMEDYVDGSMRKVFLDRYMPIAKKVVEREPNQALKQYAFDYVTAQRGALASKRRIFLNESFAQLFPNPEMGYKGVAKAVDYITRFQYMTKIGLSWFRFPFVNATQPLLTTYPLVGGKHFLQGYFDAMTKPELWKEAKTQGVIFEATLRKGLIEALGRKTMGKTERVLGAPARLSEELNRVVSYAAGKRQGMQMGLEGEKLVNHAVKVVDRTQFLYHKEALPLIMSTSPAGRLIFQFRTFTMNYINYMNTIIKEKNWPALARAAGALGVLSGSSAIPFNLWDETRKGLMRKAGVDIGDFNPVESASEMMGISPPVNLGKSMEPFNIPSSIYQLLGPTVGPVFETFFKVMAKPEDAGETLQRFFEGISPPVTAYSRAFTSPIARAEKTQTSPLGRVIGKRSVPEMLFTRPSTETYRKQVIELMANAYAGGRADIAGKLMAEGRRKGLTLDMMDMRQAKQMGMRLRGVKVVED
jgi:hypothetical protein